MASTLTGTSPELNTNQLPGGSGLLWVVASDGFLSGLDTSGAFGVPPHAPSAQILLPNADQVFFPTQQVVLQGSASSFYRGFSPGRAKIHDKKEVKYLAAAGNSGVATATA